MVGTRHRDVNWGSPRAPGRFAPGAPMGRRTAGIARGAPAYAGGFAMWTNVAEPMGIAVAAAT
jgi:hypothetical protein